MRNYHYDEDYRIVKQCDDLVSALRYAIMMRRSGKPLSECEGIGFGHLPHAMQQARHDQNRRRGGGDFDLFTGQRLN